MPDQYLDVFLTKEDFMMRDMIRNFVKKEIMPVRQQIDDDKDHIIVKEILQGIADLGIQKGAFPKEYGGGGMTSLVSAAIMHEELARGDSGIATAATVTTWAFLPAIIAGNKAVLDRFAPEFCGKALKMGCFAMTEPGGDHGGGGCDIENPSLHGKKIRTIAKLEGDSWVISGQKAWASNSGVADAYCVLCTTDPNIGDDGIALIYVPSSSDGLSFGRFDNKVGMQGDRNCMIFLDNVRVPKDFRAAGPGVDAQLMHNNVIAARVLTAALAVGNAQSSFELVLKYTGERIVADRPIRQHSICSGILADMAIGIETARNYIMTVAYMYDHPDIYGPPMSDFMLSRASIAKVYAADMAVIGNKQSNGTHGIIRLCA